MKSTSVNNLAIMQWHAYCKMSPLQQSEKGMGEQSANTIQQKVKFGGKQL